MKTTCFSGSLRSAALAPEARLWTIRSPLKLMEAKCSSLQLYDVPVIVFVWPFNHLIQRFLCKSHILTTCPLPPDHKYLDPLLLKAIENIASCNEDNMSEWYSGVRAERNPLQAIGVLEWKRSQIRSRMFFHSTFYRDSLQSGMEMFRKEANITHKCMYEKRSIDIFWLLK